MSFNGRRHLAVAATALLVGALGGQAAIADVVNLNPSQDNSMYSQNENSNGAGEWLFAGETNFAGTRRALLAFDLTGSIPAGATINSVTLTLELSQAGPAGGAVSGDLHLVTQDWGEGASNAGAPGGSGTLPAAGDATWVNRFFPGDPWTSAGGDFAAAASATTTVDQVGSYTWGSTPALVADVQGWVDNPGGNFGWILRVDEAVTGGAKRFNSRENTNAASQPLLTVDFSTGPVCGNGVIEDVEECDDGPGNSDLPGANCRTDCTLARCGDGIRDPNEECDFGEDNSDEPSGICRTDCTLNPEISVPTVNEWGLVFMGLLFLTGGTILFGRVRATAAGTKRGSSFSMDLGAPLISAPLFARVLLLTLALLGSGLMMTTLVLGLPTRVDLLGSVLCAPVLAYLVHLWLMPRR